MAHVAADDCFYLFCDAPANLPVLLNPRIGACYVTASAAVAAVGWFAGLWGVFLFWTALALGIVALAYFGLGPSIYRKTNGRLPLSTCLVLGPCLIGQHLSLVYYRRQCRPWDMVAPGVWIGRKLSDIEAAEAVSQGVTAVLDVTAEFDEAKPFLNLQYLNLPILDLTAPTQEQLKQMADFIAQHSEGGVVYVHCKIGYSRSAAAVGAYLLASKKVKSPEQALQILNEVRPTIIVRPEIKAALWRYCQLVDASANFLSTQSPQAADTTPVT